MSLVTTCPRTVIFPQTLDFQAGCRLVAELDRLPAAGEVTIDMAPLRWLEPFAMLHVASAVARRLTDCPDLQLRARGYAHQGYARFMGFLRELGITGGDDLPPNDNQADYLPIHALDLLELRADAGRRQLAAGELVDRHSKNIARTLVREGHGPLWGTVHYALREIIRNAAEHSGAAHVLYCGQYWRTRDRVEVAIIDEGVGIARSLSNNPFLAATNETAALRLALQPGVSGKAFAGAPPAADDQWGNSGFGLYVVSELCRRGGSLTLISGDTGLSVDAAGVMPIAARHAGTALRLVIDTRRLRSIAASLALIVAEGEKQARGDHAANASASKASKRLFD